MNPVIRTLREAKPGEIRLCWLGNLSWLVCDGAKLIAFDLDIDEASEDRRDERVQVSPVRSAELAAALDIQFVTHEHGDHFSAVSSKVLAERAACRFVLPTNCTGKARRIGIPDSRIRVARPGEQFTLENMDVMVLPAHHGAVTPHDCGYVVRIGGLALYQPGDTILLEQHLALRGIDVLFVSPTTHNMHIQDSVRLVSALDPKRTFAQHFGTYVESESNRFWTRGYPEELAAALPRTLAERFVIPRMGQVYVFPGSSPHA